MITLAAFVGGIGAVFVALAVARVGGRSTRADVRTLLIAGVIVGAFANAAIMVYISLPAGVLVSMASRRLTKSMFRWRKWRRTDSHAPRAVMPIALWS